MELLGLGMTAKGFVGRDGVSASARKVCSGRLAIEEREQEPGEHDYEGNGVWGGARQVGSAALGCKTERW
jgi:hypothetical protein